MPAASEDKASRQKAENGRKLLVSTSTVPEFLVAKYGLLDKDRVIFVHAVTTDQTLPHFQARLLQGQTFEGKPLASISSYFSELFM